MDVVPISIALVEMSDLARKRSSLEVKKALHLWCVRLGASLTSGHILRQAKRAKYEMAGYAQIIYWGQEDASHA
jgi:hypothetical protein